MALVENQSDGKLKYLQTDNGGEYVSNEFRYFCDTCSIKRELTTLCNLAQNGVVERMNQTIRRGCSVCFLMLACQVDFGLLACH